MNATKQSNEVTVFEMAILNAMKQSNAVPLSEIAIPGTNPRKHFDPQAERELCESVKQHGILQPVLLRSRTLVEQAKDPSGPRLELVCGERRLRAAKAAGLTEIPAVVRELTDQGVAEVQLVENLQRHDLHPLEEANGYGRLKTFGYKPEDLALKVRKSRSYVYGRLKLLDLCEKAKKALWEGQIDASRALLIARIHGGDKLQEEALATIANDQFGPASYREARDWVHSRFMLALAGAPFDPKDPSLPGGPCAACPKRTGNQPELFEDVASTDVCTDPACFTKKRDVNSQAILEKARAANKPVVELKDSSQMFHYGHLQNRNYVDLKARCDALGWEHNDSWKKTIPKTEMPNVVVAVDDAGRKHELIERGLALAALKRAGLKKPGAAKGQASDAEKKRLAKRDAQLAKLVSTVETQSAELVGDPVFWLQLAKAAALCAGHYSCCGVCRRRGWKLAGLRPADFIATAAQDLNQAQRVGLVVELLGFIDPQELARQVLSPEKPANNWTYKLMAGKFTWNKAGVCMDPASMSIPLPKPWFAEVRVAGAGDQWFFGYEVGKRGTGVGCFCASAAVQSKPGTGDPNAQAAAGRATEMILEQLSQAKAGPKIKAKVVDWAKKRGIT